MEKTLFTFKGINYRVHFASDAENTGNLWLHVGNQTIAVPLESFLFSNASNTNSRKSKSSSPSRGGSHNPNAIQAPMPGRITKIFFTLNQTIEAGEAIVIMEAMKMEYTLKAPRKCQIEKINCKIDDLVSLGEVLINLRGLDD